jgi:16S rRNA (cytosine967-C5)-methyltransferase
MAAASSHPEWLLDRWLQAFGYEDTVALCNHNNATPCFNVRINPGRASVSRVVAELEESGYSSLEHTGLLPDNFLV